MSSAQIICTWNRYLVLDSTFCLRIVYFVFEMNILRSKRIFCGKSRVSLRDYPHLSRKTRWISLGWGTSVLLDQFGLLWIASHHHRSLWISKKAKIGLSEPSNGSALHFCQWKLSLIFDLVFKTQMARWLFEKAGNNLFQGQNIQFREISISRRKHFITYTSFRRQWVHNTYYPNRVQNISERSIWTNWKKKFWRSNIPQVLRSLLLATWISPTNLDILWLNQLPIN